MPHGIANPWNVSAFEKKHTRMSQEVSKWLANGL